MENKIKIITAIVTLITAIVTLTAILLNGFGPITESFTNSNDSQATPPATATTTPFVTITQPKNNSNVDMWEWVRGTSENIPGGQELWIVVLVDGLYFPHKVETRNEEDGTWRHNVQIGQKDESGKRFELIAVLADGSAEAEIQKWYKNQDDLQRLPDGMTRYSTVTVTRNSVEKSGNPSVTITYPANNDDVNILEWVRGTSKNIPDGYQLWIVVRWDRLYFPMVDRVQIRPDGTWMYNPAIGKDDDGGEVFEIIAVLADGSAQAKVNEWYENHYDLYRLLPGMTEYSSVTVIRK